MEKNQYKTELLKMEKIESKPFDNGSLCRKVKQKDHRVS